MLLTIDIGNTRSKAALFEAGKLLRALHASEIPTVLQQVKIEAAIISRSGENESVEQTLRENKVHFITLSHNLKLPVALRYKTPQTLGADRIAGAAAAHLRFPKTNVLKIDFGTCITFDFVNNEGEYLGGAISPGVQMRLKALHHFTAKLPLIDFDHKKPELIGDSSENSILSGAVNGALAEVRETISAYRARFTNLNTIITGGDAPFFEPHLEKNIFAAPHLVAEGLHAILLLNQ